MPIYYNNFIINHWINNNVILCGKINDTFNNKYDITINKKENKTFDNYNDNYHYNDNDNDNNNDNNADNKNNELNDEIKNIYYYDNTKYNIIKKKKYKIYKSKKLN